MSTYSRAEVVNYIAQNIGRVPSATIAKQVAAFLVESGTVSDLSSIERDVLTVLFEDQGVVELTATTAHPVTASEKADIKKVVKETHQTVRNIVINENIDPKVIGGVRLEFPHQTLDMTVKAKLNKLKALTS